MRISLSALAFLAALQSLLAAPQKPAPQTPVFKTSVDLLQVDVSVLDRAGRPVEGLTAADFTLLENGASQEIANFLAVRGPSPETGSAAWVRDVPPDVHTNVLRDGRLFALVIDDATMPFDLRTLANVRRIARQVIDRLGPGDQVAVVYTRDSRRSMDFTSDRVRLLANVQALSAGTAYTDPQSDTWSYFSSVRTLAQVSSLLARVPQRRKALIYVSTGVPVNYETVANFVPLSTSRLTGIGEEAMSEDLVQSVMDFVDSRPQEAYGSAMEDAFVRAQHGNVNIYSIDPAGLGGLQAYLEKRNSMQQADRITRAGSMTPVRPNPLDAYHSARLSRDFLRTVAENSGGRAILETNDLEGGVAQIFRENSSYYLLGYRSTREPGDRRIRKVDVQVRRPDTTAHTRNAYFDPRSRPRRTDLTPELQLANAISGVVALNDLPLQVSAMPFAGPDRKTALVVVGVGIHHPVPGDVGALVNERLQLQATALTSRGQPKATQGELAELKFRSGVGEDARYEVLTRLALPPGRYQLRVAAQSSLLGRNGSVYTEIDVPDFNSGAIQMSGLILSAEPGWRLAPVDWVAGVLPALPTTVREFESTTDVRVLARVYERTHEALVRAAITDETGSTVFTRDTPLETVRFTSQGSADYQLSLPISRLKPGRYLLTLDASAKQKTVSRQVRFSVK
jgi:VWFA-related protein